MKFFQAVVCFVALFVAPVASQTGLSDFITQSSVSSSVSGPITGKERFRWFMTSTVGTASLTSGLFSSGFSTAINHPPEYGPHWDGFGKRYGIRLTGLSAGNAMEAGLGALWGEDPRYFRARDVGFRGRLRHVMIFSFEARRPDGHLAPAYARYIGIAGNNFLSNAWRVNSDSSAGDALRRTGIGFAGEIVGNALAEFWPDVQKRLFRH